MSELRPAVQQLGSIRQTATGRVTMYVTIAMGGVVALIMAAAGGSGWVRFDVFLRSGLRVCVDRLRLKPIMGAAGMQHHPDVQAALNPYAAWRL